MKEAAENTRSAYKSDQITIIRRGIERVTIDVEATDSILRNRETMEIHDILMELKKHASSSSDPSLQVGSKQGFSTPSSSSGILPVPVPSVVPAAGATNASTLSFAAEHGHELNMKDFAIYLEHFPSGQLLIRSCKLRHLSRKNELHNMNRRKYPRNTLLEDAKVAVYKINDLSDQRNRAMVHVNAENCMLAGCAVITNGISVVVVCGKRKSINRYNRMMLGRIKWGEGKIKAEDDDNEDKTRNECVLLWKGCVAKSSFDRFSVHECGTTAAARKVFLDAGVTQYWDLAVQDQI